MALGQKDASRRRIDWCASFEIALKVELETPGTVNPVSRAAKIADEALGAIEERFGAGMLDENVADVEPEEPVTSVND